MPIQNGQLTDANDVINLFKIQQLYEGTGFNSSQSGVGGTYSEYELSDIPASKLTDANYVIIETMCRVSVSKDSSYGEPRVLFSIYIKELGGSYSTIFEEEIKKITGSSSSLASIDFLLIRKVYELTSGMKSNGIKIKLRSGSFGSTGGGANFTNHQTTVRLAT